MIIFSIMYISYNMKGTINDNGLNRASLLWWDPLQPQRLLDSLPSFNFLLCVLHLPHMLKASSDDKWDVNPDKFLAWAPLAVPLTGFSLQIVMLPPTAQLFYHPSDEIFHYLRCSQGTRRQKKSEKGPHRVSWMGYSPVQPNQLWKLSFPSGLLIARFLLKTT